MKGCMICRKVVYVVQNEHGGRFLVAHDGTRWHR